MWEDIAQIFSGAVGGLGQGLTQQSLLKQQMDNQKELMKERQKIGQQDDQMNFLKAIALKKYGSKNADSFGVDLSNIDVPKDNPVMQMIVAMLQNKRAAGTPRSTLAPPKPVTRQNGGGAFGGVTGGNL